MFCTTFRLEMQCVIRIFYDLINIQCRNGEHDLTYNLTGFQISNGNHIYWNDTSKTNGSCGDMNFSVDRDHLYVQIQNQASLSVAHVRKTVHGKKVDYLNVFIGHSYAKPGQVHGLLGI